MWSLHSRSNTAQHLYLWAAKGSKDAGLILRSKGVEITLGVWGSWEPPPGGCAQRSLPALPG